MPGLTGQIGDRQFDNFVTRWLWTYNHGRPNMALGGITPQQKSALAE
jgi:putative transposase